MLTQGATLGAPASHCGRIARRQAPSGPSSARTQSRGTCQATFGGSQPGPQRVREQSPSRIQAVAAPGLDRPQLQQQQQQQLATAVSLLEEHLEKTAAYLRDAGISSSNTTTLELSRAHAERLFQLEAAAAALQEASAATLHTRRSAVPAVDEVGQLPSAEDEAAQDEEEAVAAQEAEQQQRGQAEQQRRERRQRSAAAASTSGRAAQPKQGRTVVLSTRRAAAAARPRSGPTPVSPTEAAMTPALTSWLVDCGSRQLRVGASLAAAPAPDTAAPAADAAPQRFRRLVGSNPQQQEAAADAAGLAGLSEQTHQDMVALVNARLTLRKARGTKRARSGPGDSAMTSFMKGTSNTPVLGKGAEARLAAILQRGRQLDFLAASLKKAGKGRTISDAELAAEAGLVGPADVARRRKNAAEARDLLLQYNVRLVINIAKRYTASGIDIADLIPEGMVGLGKAVDRFEPSRGFKFSTYSHWWIRQAVSRAVTDQARVVRLPSHVNESLYRINRTIATKVEQSECEEPPTFEEIAGEVGLPVSRVIQYLKLGRLPGSPGLRGSAGQQGYSFMHGTSQKEVTPAMLQDSEVEDGGGDEVLADEVEREFGCMKAVTDLMLSTLPKRERNILRLRYGLLGWNQQEGMERGPTGEDSATMSLGEVAVAYGLSKERIRQIEDKAMRALRKPWRQQLVQELNFGQRVTPSSLSHLVSAQQVAAEEAL